MTIKRLFASLLKYRLSNTIESNKYILLQSLFVIIILGNITSLVLQLSNCEKYVSCVGASLITLE